MSTAKVAYRGVPFENGLNEDGSDKIIIIPPLTINRVRQSTQEVTEIKDEDPLAQVHKQNEKVKEIILEAINRNYPEFTKDELENFLTYQNIQPAYQAALGSNSSPDGKLLPVSVRSAGEILPESPHL